MTALGILIATFTTSMAQFGVLCIPYPAAVVGLQHAYRNHADLAAEHYADRSQDAFRQLRPGVLYRGAGLDIVWPQLVAMTVISGVIFAISGLRFRRTLVASQ